MKRTEKLLFTSFATLLVLLTLLVGATYALFTSSAQESLVVSTAQVKYEASITLEEAKEYKGQWVAVVGDSGNFGSAERTFSYAGGVLTVSNAIPGDALKFTINITNTSTIETDYKVEVSSVDNEGNLTSVLVVTMNGAPSNWTSLAANTDATVEVVVEFPSTADNTYQAAECQYVITVLGSQGNAQ